jgi:hypothetical protein
MVMRIQPHLFTMMADSSMIQLAPITMGPAMAKIVALGCTIVPVHASRECRLGRAFQLVIPEPIVMSPLSSTSWHTTAFEWIVNLSRLNALFQNENFNKMCLKLTLEACTWLIRMAKVR